MENKRKIALFVEGIHCAACVARIEKEISSLEGVESASVHLPTSTAFVSYDPSRVSEDAVKSAVKSAGYKVLNVSESAESAYSAASAGMLKESFRLSVKFWSAFVLSLLILTADYFQFSGYTKWILATVIWAWCGSHFHAGMMRSLRSKAADMNTLVSLSTSTAYFYSIAAEFLRGSIYGHSRWEDVAVLITFINLGKWLEIRSRQSSGRSITKLLNMAPKFARVIVSGGKEIIVPVAEIKSGDILSVRPGEQVPVDGIIEKGFSSLDESLLTGESVPVDKEPSNAVYGGTLNKTGALEIKAVQVGAEMALSRIVRAVHESQSTKPHIQRMADKTAYYFVPAVFILAVSAGVVWAWFGPAPKIQFSIAVFISVLAVACPCALGLAVPMALVVGIDRGAGLGVLIRNAEIMEKAGSVDTVILDKTGTLTEGKPRVSGIYPAGADAELLLRCALAVEEKSPHPFAEAVTRMAKERNVTPPAIEHLVFFPGRGIKAESREGTIRAGSMTWLKEEGIEAPQEAGTQEGSVINVSLKRQWLGYFTVSDTIKPSALHMAAELEKMGIEPILVSGDKKQPVESIAVQAGIKQYHYEIMPEEKAKIVGRLQSRGRKVAFVGDGFNDAPAISKADVGMAFNSGTDIAAESADIILMRNDMRAVMDAIGLSRAMQRVIKENLFWAFIYNILLIPLAAGAFYPLWGVMLPPYAAGAAMAVSSVSVVWNSLKLRRWGQLDRWTAGQRGG